MKLILDGFDAFLSFIKKNLLLFQNKIKLCLKKSKLFSAQLYFRGPWENTLMSWQYFITPIQCFSTFFD